MNTTNVENFLEHYGVKGMRWGIRKDKKFGGRSNKKPKPKASDFSDEELRRYLNRVQMERQYRQLNPSKLQKGGIFIKSALAIGATANAVYAFAKSPVGQQIAKSFK